ncbi:MAG: hypothetical protein COA36_16745 [Desulfotalea sp.]|nr:MAG: hypothetical protein COA36_16745 [Desulfotalea sp.]
MKDINSEKEDQRLAKMYQCKQIVTIVTDRINVNLESISIMTKIDSKADHLKRRIEIDRKIIERVTGRYWDALNGGVWMVQCTETLIVMGIFDSQQKAIKYAGGGDNMAITNMSIA